jgi:hypothetical protein
VLVGSTNLNLNLFDPIKMDAAADLACFSHAESEEFDEA